MASTKIKRCIECGFPTKEIWVIVPDGRAHSLCRQCSGKIPKAARNPYQQILDGERGGSQPRGNYKITPELQERAVALRKEGMTYEDIAEAMGISAASVFKLCRGKV